MATPVFTPLPQARPGCELCASAGGTLLWSHEGWRVVRVDDAAFPAFYRVICNHHVSEFSELLAPERQRCMDIVCAVERVLIEQLQPTKVNLAALGNVVPHLHWHVVARFDWDSHFPQPIWGVKQRDVDPPPLARIGGALPELDDAVIDAVVRASSALP
jgi:diadenosine tetraphosphate (Ap4A) HIT family hydrolase